MLGGSTIKVGKALDEMRHSTSYFSLRFVTYDANRPKKSRLVFVQRASCYKNSPENEQRDLIDIQNVDTGDKIRVHKFLITDFNNNRVVI